MTDEKVKEEKPKEEPKLWFNSKKTVLFQKDEIKEDNFVPNSRVQIVSDQFTLVPNSDPRVSVQAPAWIKDTDFYKLLRKEGSITETEAPSEEEQEKQAQQAHQAKAGAGLPSKWQR